MGDTVQLRFRHTGGDLGPFTFAETSLIQNVKEKLVAEWPKDGPLAKEIPAQANDIKLILSGKYVEATKPLKDYKKDMGDATAIVTMHVVVRPTTTTNNKVTGSVAPPPKEVESSGCGCIIS